MSQAVRFFGPINDSTGYGVAVGNFAKAFSNSSVNTKFVFGGRAEEKYKELISKLKQYDGACQVDFYLHGPPWTKHKSQNYKIAYFYWEADTLPPGWVRSINTVDEIWAPCDLVYKACLRAGFRGVLKIVPTPLEEWETDKKLLLPSPYHHDQVVAKDVYKFYSIFQWHERKGPKELLLAYWKEFDRNDKVILLLKTNPLNVKNYTAENIRNEIFRLKSKLNQGYYAPVYLMKEVVSTEKIRALHNTADCYVSAHRGEGWSLPINDAMYAGKQIITTKFGGVTEYLDDDSAHIVPHTLGPVRGMDWLTSLYNANQRWAYPSVTKLSNLMRDVYEHHHLYSLKPKRAQEVARTMTISEVSKIIEGEFKNPKIRGRSK